MFSFYKSILVDAFKHSPLQCFVISLPSRNVPGMFHHASLVNANVSLAASHIEMRLSESAEVVPGSKDQHLTCYL